MRPAKLVQMEMKYIKGMRADVYTNTNMFVENIALEIYLD